jgi:hypothetical protein
MLIVSSKSSPYDFVNKVQEISGFNFDEKIKVFEILSTFGMPVAVDEKGEVKEDYHLLKTLLDKAIYGNEHLTFISEQKVN